MISFRSIVAFWLTILIVSCGASSNSTQATKIDALLSTAPGLKPETSPTKTSRLISTLTTSIPTANPPTVTPVATTSPAPAWTAVPTLTKLQARDHIAILMEANAGCSLPCWWGIVPGETNWQSAYHFFRPFATDIETGGESVIEFSDRPLPTDYYVYYEIPGIEMGGGARITIKDGIVIELLTGPYSTMENSQLNQILSTYGEPDEVFINTVPRPGPFGHPFSLVLLYSDQRVMLDYEIEASQVGDLVSACPEVIGPWLWIRSLDDPWTVMSIEKTILGPDARGEVLSIDEATDYDLVTFTKKFINHNSCIESPSSVWE